jgi:para-nitrobenzyl esterase
MARVSTFLLMVALIAGVVGCGGGGVEYDLTIASSAGGSVTTPEEVTSTHDRGTVVNLVAEAEEGYHFVNWTGDVGTIADVEAASTTITMNDDYSITANFVKQQYDLTIASTTGGSVTGPGEAGPYTYNMGTMVNLVAEAEEGYQFVNWTGDVATIGNINTAITTITMNDNYEIAANFAQYIPMVAAGCHHTVGLTSNGTVVAVGNRTYGKCNVGDWTGIVQVAAGCEHTVGLKSDGTVVAAGYGEQCKVGGWTNISQVAAGVWHTVGLKSDGTVVAVGLKDYGQCNVGNWTHITQVSAGIWHTVGLKSDGTVVAVGKNDDGQCNVGGWTDIIQVAAGYEHTVGLKSDGTVVAVGVNWPGQSEVGGWTDIIQVAAGGGQTVGLKSDGTVVAVGYYAEGECEVGDWTGIVQVAAAFHHTVGLKSDGKVLAVGLNGDGQCNVSDWMLEEPALTDPIKIDTGYVSGEFIGEAGHEVRIYKGIPYAAPPVGDLRWKPPQPPASWTGIRDCTVFSKMAPQLGSPNPAVQSEDCLYLNVLTPAKKASDKLPVMVWMHEGSYVMGSGNEPFCNLPWLPQHGVLLVTVNMRLDVLGLLAHPLLSKESPNGVSGNYMFLDMIAALEWVQRNIGAFGGDPNNVTIFGESGGGAKIAVLMASPLAKGLFHRAICESGTSMERLFPSRPLKDMEALGKEFFVELGVDKEADPLKAARSLSWEKLIAVSSSFHYQQELTSQLGYYCPTTDAAVDGWFLTDTPANIFKAGKQNPVPFITLSCLGEITGPGIPSYPFFVFPSLILGYTDMLANAGKAGVSGYAAMFEHVPSNWKAEGGVATHTIEVPYVFGDMDSESALWDLEFWFASLTTGVTQRDPGLTDGDRQLSEDMMAMWTQFAKTGDPSVPGLIEWPAYNSADDQYLSLDELLLVESGFSSIAAE